MLAARSSVAAAFSSSSLSLAATADTSPVLHLSTPRLVARSPSLLKANRGIADASAIRGPEPPCVFTLRGKGQTRGQGGESSDRSATVNVSPRRVIRVETGEGYSPRLRMMGAEGRIDGDMTRAKTAAAVPPSSTAFDPHSQPSPPASPSAEASTGGERAQSSDIAAMTYNRPSPYYPCQEDTAPRGPEDLPPEAAAEGTMDVEGKPARASRRSPSHPRERPRTPPRKGYLCGRLWTGTTASPKSDEARPRVLFLVSGQQQRLKEAARRKQSMVRGRQEESRVHPPVVVPLPPPAEAKKAAVGATSTRSSRRRAAGSRVQRRSTSCDGSDWGQAGEAREGMSVPGSTSGPDGDDESYEGGTSAATAGKGDSSGRTMVLHVRVPRPPPTSLLVLRSAPPST